MPLMTAEPVAPNRRQQTRETAEAPQSRFVPVLAPISATNAPTSQEALTGLGHRFGQVAAQPSAVVRGTKRVIEVGAGKPFNWLNKKLNELSDDSKLAEIPNAAADVLSVAYRPLGTLAKLKARINKKAQRTESEATPESVRQSLAVLPVVRDVAAILMHAMAQHQHTAQKNRAFL